MEDTVVVKSCEEVIKSMMYKKEGWIGSMTASVSMIDRTSSGWEGLYLTDPLTPAGSPRLKNIRDTPPQTQGASNRTGIEMTTAQIR